MQYLFGGDSEYATTMGAQRASKAIAANCAYLRNSYADYATALKDFNLRKTEYDNGRTGGNATSLEEKAVEASKKLLAATEILQGDYQRSFDRARKSPDGAVIQAFARRIQSLGDVQRVHAENNDTRLINSLEPVVNPPPPGVRIDLFKGFPDRNQLISLKVTLVKKVKGNVDSYPAYDTANAAFMKAKDSYRSWKSGRGEDATHSGHEELICASAVALRQAAENLKQECATRFGADSAVVTRLSSFVDSLHGLERNHEHNRALLPKTNAAATVASTSQLGSPALAHAGGSASSSSTLEWSSSARVPQRRPLSPDEYGPGGPSMSTHSQYRGLPSPPRRPGSHTLSPSSGDNSEPPRKTQRLKR